MEQTIGQNNDCQCDECKGACEFKPGWFKPGEAEKVAEALGVSLPELFHTYLGVDWWEDDEDIFLLSPAVEEMLAGNEFSSNPTGQCVFFQDEKCFIHAVKPFECRAFHHSDEDDIKQSRHKEVAESWREHQDQIKELLGRTPQSSSFSFFDLLFGGSCWDD